MGQAQRRYENFLLLYRLIRSFIYQKSWNSSKKNLDEGFKRENQYNHTGCNVYDGHTIKSQPMGFWIRADVLQYKMDHRIPICCIYGEVVWDKTGEWVTTGESRTGCVMCGFGCHLEKEPNRIQRLRCSKNPVHRRMCEGILKIENHGVTYEEALQRCHIATTIEEIQSDAEDKGRAA